MSEPVIALGGARFAHGIAKVTEVPLQGMITLRGDLAEKSVQTAATLVAAGDMPQARQARITGDTGVAWMSPDEALILCPYAAVAETMGKMQKVLGEAHALVLDVSDARASFQIRGPRAREVLGKLCPVDFSEQAFGPGSFRRTRMAQVPAALWPCGHDVVQLVCFRSHAQYVFDLLCVAAQPGSAVWPEATPGGSV